MTAKQIRELEIYYSIEPFCNHHEELRHGQSLEMLANINRDREKRPEPFTPSDFMNFDDPVIEKIYTIEELEAYADKVFS